MSHRRFVLAAAVLAASVPTFCLASPERAALSSCVQAFAASLASPGAGAPTFKVNYKSGALGGSMLEFYTREYTFDLYANDLKTGLPIGRASCATDYRGAVTALAPLPMQAAALTAARN
jgi:hypothetical protein